MKLIETTMFNRHLKKIGLLLAGILVGLPLQPAKARAQGVEPHVTVSDSSFNFVVRAKSTVPVLVTVKVDMTAPAGKLFTNTSGTGPTIYTQLKDTITPTELTFGFRPEELNGATPGNYTEILAVRAFGARPAFITLNIHVDSAMSIRVVKVGDTTKIDTLEATVFAGEAPRDTVLNVINPLAANGGGLFHLRAGVPLDADSLRPPWINASLSSDLSPAKLTITLSDLTLKPGQDTGAVVHIETDSSITIEGNPTNLRVRLHVHGPRGTIGLSRSVVEESGPAALEFIKDSVIIYNVGAGIENRFQKLAYVDSTAKPWLSLSLSSRASPAILRISVVPRAIAQGKTDTAVVIIKDPESTNQARLLIIASSTGQTTSLIVATDTVRLGIISGATVSVSLPVTSSTSAPVKGLTAKVVYLSGAGGWLQASLGGSTPTNLILTGIVPNDRRMAVVEIRNTTLGANSISIPVTIGAGSEPGNGGTLIVSGSTTEAVLVGQEVIPLVLILTDNAASIEATGATGYLTASLAAGQKLTINPKASLSAGIYQLVIAVKDGTGQDLGSFKATIIVADAVSLKDAVNALGNIGAIKPEQAAWLDWQGNRNGRLDIGDITKQILK